MVEQRPSVAVSTDRTPSRLSISMSSADLILRPGRRERDVSRQGQSERDQHVHSSGLEPEVSGLRVRAMESIAIWLVH